MDTRTPRLEAETNGSAEDIVLASRNNLSQGVSLSIATQTLASSPNLILKQGSVETVIPIEVAELLSKHGYDLIRESNKNKSRLRLLENHPNTLDQDIVAFNEGFNSRLIFKNSDKESEATPVLSWRSNIADSSQSIDPVDLWEGWVLTLAGKEIGSALWSDVDGIKNLITAMKNSDALKVSLALSDPKASLLLSSRTNLLNMYRNRELPLIGIAEVKKLIVDSGLQGKTVTRRVDHAGHLVLFDIMIGRVKIPVAVGISAPVLASMASTTVTKGSISLPAIHYAKKDWMKLFIKRIEASLEWRVVDFQLDSDEESFIWITKVSEEDWSKIEVAVKYQASIFIKDEWVKF